MRTPISDHAGTRYSLGDHKRRGSLLTEMVVCTILLGAVTSVMIPILSRLIEQRKMIRYDTLCVVELDNAAQQIRSRVAAGRSLDDLPLTVSFMRRYPQATLTAESLGTGTEPDAEPGSDQSPSKSLQAIRIRITRPGLPEMPDIVRTLVIWVPISSDLNSPAEQPVEPVQPVVPVEPVSVGEEVQP